MSHRTATVFRKFIKDFSCFAPPLTDLTGKQTEVKGWNEKYDDAFRRLTEALSSGPTLVALRWDRNFRCQTDATQLAVEGTLTRLDNDRRE